MRKLRLLVVDDAVVVRSLLVKLFSGDPQLLGAPTGHVLPVRDYYNETRWVQAVRASVAQQVPADARIGLVGHFKDATSSYLSEWMREQLLA